MTDQLETEIARMKGLDPQLPVTGQVIVTDQSSAQRTLDPAVARALAER